MSTLTRRLHVLYVAWGFAPHRGPGVYRPLATVNELVRRGHRVTVLTADLDTFAVAVGGDESLLGYVDPRVRVVRVPMQQDVRDPIINRWSMDRARNQRAWSRAVVRAHERSFPEAVYAPWGPRAESVARLLHAQDPVDLTIATGNPYVDFTVAITLGVEHGVPFVLDDRDSWLLDVYTGEQLPDADRIRPWLELALASCLEYWFVNPAIAQWHCDRFPEHAAKIRVVENGWDPTFLDPDRLAAHRPASSPLRVSYVGTINSRLPLRRMAEAWRVARAESSVLSDAQLDVVGHFGHAGTVTPEQAVLRDEFAADGVVFPGRRPKDQIAETYAESDVLLFAKEGSHMVTSGKVYEYVATGLPIVSMVEPIHDARRVLDGYPRLHDAADSSVEAVAAALVAAARDAVEQPENFGPALAFGSKLRRDTVLASALSRVEEALQHAG